MGCKKNRQDSRKIKQTVKFREENLIQNHMNQDTIRYATKIDGKIDANLYTEIIGDNLLKSLEYDHQIENIYFQ